MQVDATDVEYRNEQQRLCQNIYYVERHNFPVRGSYADAAYEGGENVTTIQQIEWTSRYADRNTYIDNEQGDVNAFKGKRHPEDSQTTEEKADTQTAKEDLIKSKEKEEDATTTTQEHNTVHTATRTADKIQDTTTTEEGAK
eukprot:1592722-Amphidinium_carterae.2